MNRIPIALFCATAVGCSGSGKNPPTAPSGVTATAGDARVTVKWNAVAGASDYAVYYTTLPQPDRTGPHATSTANTLELDGLVNGTTYLEFKARGPSQNLWENDPNNLLDDDVLNRRVLSWTWNTHPNF